MSDTTAEMSEYSVFVCSPAHVPGLDIEQLKRLSRDVSDFPPANAGIVADTAFGCWLWIGDEGLSAEDEAMLNDAGLSPTFTALLSNFHRQAGGFCYVIVTDGCSSASATTLL